MCKVNQTIHVCDKCGQIFVKGDIINEFPEATEKHHVHKRCADASVASALAKALANYLLVSVILDTFADNDQFESIRTEVESYLRDIAFTDTDIQVSTVLERVAARITNKLPSVAALTAKTSIFDRGIIDATFDMSNSCILRLKDYNSEYQYHSIFDFRISLIRTPQSMQYAFTVNAFQSQSSPKCVDTQSYLITRYSELVDWVIANCDMGYDHKVIANCNSDSTIEEFNPILYITEGIHGERKAGL